MKGNRHAGPEITVSDKVDPKRFTRPNAIKIAKLRIKKEYLKHPLCARGNMSHILLYIFIKAL